MGRTGLARRALLLASMAFVAGCVGSGIWPFGGREAAAVGAVPAREAEAIGSVAGLPLMADGTVLLPALRIAAAERGRQGVILRVDGVAPIQGFHSPELRPVGRSPEGIETVELRAAAPAGEAAVGPERTRLLSVGRFYSNRDMEEITGFRVVSAGGAATVPVP